MDHKETAVMKIMLFLNRAQEDVQDIKNTAMFRETVESANQNIKLAKQWMRILKQLNK